MSPHLHFIVDMDRDTSLFSPSFGVGYLSSYLQKHLADAKVSMSLMSDDIEADIERNKPDILGISSTTRHFATLSKKAKYLKSRFDLPVIYGGVHISISPEDLPAHAELGVLGEGEQTVVELLANFRANRFRNLETIRGIAYWNEGKIVVNPNRPFIEKLDELPYPDWDLLRVPWNRRHRAVMVTSRGCPFKCRFCASSRYWDRTRLHSPDYVIAQMKAISGRFGVREILIYDDFFTIDRKRVHRISELVRGDSALRKIRFECLSRADIFDESVAESLKKMGVYRVAFGIESGSQMTLDYLKNGALSIEQARKAVQLAKSHRIECVGSFMIGSPYETADQIEETFEFIRTLDLDAVQITIATPFPGTELWEDGKRTGAITGSAWSDDYYVLHSYSPDFRPEEALAGKKLLTPLPRETFLEFVRKAGCLSDEINRSRRNVVKAAWRALLRNPLGFPVRALQRTRDISRKTFGARNRQP